MGIVNVSPESFSDGDEVTTVDRQLARATELLDAGADLIDVGGESGVTNRPPVEASEEIRRVVSVAEALVDAGALVSVDTWKAPVALAALEAGAHLINDVSGLRDPTIAAHCARFGAGLVLMHTRAAPKVKAFPVYEDVVDDVVAFLGEGIDAAMSQGVPRDHLVLDPGPDFAKTPAQTVSVLRRLADLSSLDRPVLLAVSRKDFVGALTGRLPRQRLAGSLAAVGAGLERGASILRVHDVADTVDFLRVRAALLGIEEVAPDLHLDEDLRRQHHVGAG
jgi:dihydropteroate synthase